MKGATEELNLTIVAIIAIAGIAFFFGTTLWPGVKNSIKNDWNQVDKNSALKDD